MIAGYVLAGGQSRRMGRDKAWVQLGGTPLIARALETLRCVCEQVSILSSDEALRVFAPLVPDVHPGCGPLGGMEAALMHTQCEWNVFLPVDLPFLPASMLQHAVNQARQTGRGVMFRAEGRPQPTVAVLDAQVLPFVSEAVATGQFKVLPVLARAAIQIVEAPPGRWFANVNTPEDLVQAETWAHLLDTSARDSIG